MLFSWEAVLNTDKRQQIPKTIISISLLCSKSRPFTRPQSFLLTCKDLSEIFKKKCRQQKNSDSNPKEAWHYNHVTSTPIAKHFMLYCRLIYMLSMLYVRLMIKVKVKIPESFKVGWCPHKITGSSHLNAPFLTSLFFILKGPEDWHELNLTDPNQPNHFGKNKQSPIDI